MLKTESPQQLRSIITIYNKAAQGQDYSDCCNTTLTPRATAS